MRLIDGPSRLLLTLVFAALFTGCPGGGDPDDDDGADDDDSSSQGDDDDATPAIEAAFVVWFCIEDEGCWGDLMLPREDGLQCADLLVETYFYDADYDFVRVNLIRGFAVDWPGTWYTGYDPGCDYDDLPGRRCFMATDIGPDGMFHADVGDTLVIDTWNADRATGSLSVGGTLHRFDATSCGEVDNPFGDDDDSAGDEAREQRARDDAPRRERGTSWRLRLR